VNGAIHALPCDLPDDFEPIALTTGGTNLIDANKAMPANDLKNLIGLCT
jgi:hypothetical protein